MHATSWLTLALLLSLSSAGDVLELVLKDSTIVKGEVVRENLKGVLLKDRPDPGLIPWTSVQSVNGRPVKERIDQLRQTLKAVLCHDCAGGRVALLCPECQGHGKSYGQFKACTKCAGAGSAACTVKGCDKGKVDCPAPCLKRSVGIWKNGYRMFIIRDEAGKVTGTSGISENHLGEVFEFKVSTPVPNCAKCFGTKSACRECRESGTFILGPFKSLGGCETCPGRAGKLNCTACQGTGSPPCTGCMGTKEVPILESAAPCGLCKDGVVPCSFCENTGLVQPRQGKSPSVSSTILSLRGDIRVALQRLEDANLTTVDRVVFRDGRFFQGQIVHKMPGGVMLGVRAPGPQDLQILPALAKYGYRVSPAASAPGAPAAGEKKPDASAPAAAPDTVVLKDGTTVSGKIVARSEELLMVQTPDGKFIKIEAAKVAEVKSQPKK